MTERTLFLDALEIIDPAQRNAFLDQACGGDTDLRGRVESLLTAHERTGEFLDVPALEQMSAGNRPDTYPLSPSSNAESRDPVHPWRPAGGQPIELAFLQPANEPGVLGRLGHYQVQAVIGEGGMGTVLRALDESLQRVVAVKVLAPQLAASATARQRFLREARAAAAVRHPHVVAIHAVDEAGLVPYLVMQLVPGESLQERLRCQGPLPIAEVVRIGREAAEGLAAAHEQGLIHRDVKPANILLEAGTSSVRLTDFGLARAADDVGLTRSGVIAGTPMYMAPEQARGEAVDHRADLFSLGSVLYAMCTGSPPFNAASTPAILRRVSEDTPPPISQLRPDVPEWLAAIMARLHAKGPDQRFSSAAEVADLLGQGLAHLQQPEEVPAPVIEGPEGADSSGERQPWYDGTLSGDSFCAGPVLLRSPLRKRVTAGMVATVVGALAAGMILSLWLAVQARSAERQALSQLAAERKARLEAEAQAAEHKRVGEEAVHQAQTVIGLMETLLAELPEAARADGAQLAMPVQLRLEQTAARLDGALADQPLLRARLNVALGQAYLSMGQPAKAAPLLEKALYDRCVTLGQEHADTHAVRQALFTASRLSGNLARARDLLDQLQTRRDPEPRPSAAPAGNKEAPPGSSSADRIEQNHMILTHQLAVSYYQAGDVARSVPLFAQVVSQAEVQLGENHPDTLTCRNNLVAAYQQTRQYREAVQELEKVLGGSIACYGRDDPRTLSARHALAQAHFANNQPVAALEQLNGLVARERKLLGKDDPRLANLLAQVGQEMLHHGYPVPAEKLLRECLAIRQKTEPDSWPTGNTQSMLGGVLLELRKAAEAEPLLLQGYQDMKQHEDRMPPDGREQMVEALQRLVKLDETNGNPSRRDRWRALLEEIQSPQVLPAR